MRSIIINDLWSSRLDLSSMLMSDSIITTVSIHYEKYRKVFQT